MITVKEAAMRWNLTERRIASLCKEGKIDGAEKKGKRWFIPAAAGKPADKRVKSGTYSKNNRSVKLPLPVGISDYRLASTEYYYVDKTLMIKDFIDERPMVSLYTRPRRFGKTLNMDMLRVFFEKSDTDTSALFTDKMIWTCGEKYRAYQGKYPVIFVTFKDVKCKTWEETLEKISTVFQAEFSRHRELADSRNCGKYELDYYRKIIDGNASEIELTSAFLNLSQMLDEHHGIPPIIIIDEYDTPIQQGHSHGFYEKVILFMRNLFSGGLKDNKHLSYGFLTGILRVAKESIFSGLNNLTIHSILDNKYSKYFGFTPDEVKAMAKYYKASDKYDEINNWYDGYRFGSTEIFNPWSVINYFSNDCQPRAFWQSTGNNDIIGEILEAATPDVYDRLRALLNESSFLTYIDTCVIYPEIKNNPSSIYSFLLVAGYLKVIKSEISFNGDYMCEVALPNKEITYVYNKEILEKLSNVIPQPTVIAIQEALYAGDSGTLHKQLSKLLAQSVSYHDTANEAFYHGWMLGLCAMVDNYYYVTSNVESGDGRYDVQLMPKKTSAPGVLIELKAAKGMSEDELKALAFAALEQIDKRKYDTDMKVKGVKTIFKYGVAFSGKQVEVAELTLR